MREAIFQTGLTELLGIRHPILCGGLMWLADARYVGAVCNAGALGFITALSFPDPEQFREQIRLCRSLVGDKPFGINLSVSRRPGVNERIRRHIEVAIDERVPVVETSGSSPEEILPRLKEAGSKVIHKVPHLKYARSVARQAVDAIIIVGGEAGGHPGVLLTSTMVQAGMAADELSLPWVIGGGIGAGRQLTAALAMGAGAVLLGTRMLAAREIWAHENYKKRLVAGDGLDSVLRMQLFQDTHRVMRNKSSEAVAQLEAMKIRNFEAYRPHVDGPGRARRLRKRRYGHRHARLRPIGRLHPRHRERGRDHRRLHRRCRPRARTPAVQHPQEISMNVSRLVLAAVRLAAAMGAVGALTANPAMAQETYPSHVVKLVVPYAAGGSTDPIARLFAKGLSEVLQRQVIVDNRPGANGLIGTEGVARAAPDGYTLLLGPIATNAIAGSLYTHLPYDPIKDFVAVTEVARSPLLLVVGPSLPVKSLAELQAYARANPGKLNYASGGQGTASHIGAALLAHRAGLVMQHVPYKGSGLALNDVLGGHTDLMFDSIATSLQQVRGGKLRALGISSASRSPIAPEIPTLAEAGLPGFELVWWFGLFAPRGTPMEIVNKLSAASIDVLTRPETRVSFAAQGLEAVGSTPADFGRKVVHEADVWGKVIRDAGIKVE